MRRHITTVVHCANEFAYSVWWIRIKGTEIKKDAGALFGSQVISVHSVALLFARHQSS